MVGMAGQLDVLGRESQGLGPDIRGAEEGCGESGGRPQGAARFIALRLALSPYL